MSWARLSGSFCFHRKVLEADSRTKHRASGAFARMLSWSVENMTTGKLSAGVALTIAQDQRVLDVLLNVRLLERHEGDYVIHDYCEYNPTGEELAARRAELRAKRSDAGRRGAVARWGRGKMDDGVSSPGMAHEAQDPGKPEGHLPSPGMAHEAQDPDKPKGHLPSPGMAHEAQDPGNPEGHLPSPGMANECTRDGKGHGKPMPTLTLTSTSQIPPPTVVDLALTRTEPTAETRGRRKSNARAAKHTAEQIAAKDWVIQTFIECFEAKKHVEPKAILAADHAMAFTLVQRLGADEACSVVRRAFEHDFVVRENATLRYIASRADTFRGTAPQKARDRHAQQRVVGDEPWLREHLS